MKRLKYWEAPIAVRIAGNSLCWTGTESGFGGSGATAHGRERICRRPRTGAIGSNDERGGGYRGSGGERRPGGYRGSAASEALW